MSIDYPFASVTATITGGPGNSGDNLVFAQAGSSDSSFVGSPFYLNGSYAPPNIGLTNAVVNVPSVDGSIWNPSGSFPPTPPTVNWELRFRNGSTGSVIARQLIVIDILKRTNPFFPNLSQIGVGSNAAAMICNLGSAVAPNIDAQVIITNTPLPDLNSIKVRYTIDDVPVGPIVTGPTSVFDRFDLTIDTSNVFGTGPLTDGAHALGVIMVDPTSSTNPPPYYFRLQYANFLVNNSGRTWAEIYAGPITLPSIEPGIAPQYRFNSGKLDFVTFPGFAGPGGVVATGGTHNTVVPIPSPQSGRIPPASDPASPMHGLTPTQQRNNQLWFTEGLGGATPTEYLVSPRFFATKDGAVYIQGYNGETGQTLEGSYSVWIKHCNFDGQRNDNQTDQISSGIDGHDGTYWVVFEAFGRIIKATHTGTITTLAGQTTDRTKLGFAYSDGSITEDDLNAIMIQVGTIVSPTFGDLRGINDGCWDLRDPTPGNSLLVANAIDHYIAKITGLVNGPVTMFRIAGQDGGLGRAQVNTADNGGYVDGPATEFVAGASNATFVGSVSGGVLTVVSGYTVTGGSGLQPGCPLSWSGNLNTSTGNMVTAHISGSGNGSTWRVNFATSGGNQSMAASAPVALFAGPYSIKMCDGVRGPDPLGTMYIADYQNSAIRKISADGSTVSTLFGNQTGALRWNAAGPVAGSLVGMGSSSSPVNITSATWSGNVLTVVAAAPVVQPGIATNYATISPYWTITLGGFTNTGSGGPGAVAGNFQVLAVTDSQHFTLSMPAGAGVIGTVGGPGTVTFWSDDVYLPSAPTPRLLNHGGAQEAYCPLPQRVVINSIGKLVIGHTWFDAVSTVDLAAGTIVYTGQYGCTVPNTRLNAGGSRANVQLNFQISWFQIDVDSGVAGDVSTIGCAGPKDDIFMLNSNGNITGYYWRCASDGTSAGVFISNDMNRTQPLPVGRQGGGHYEWMITISRHQGRMLTSGIADSGINSWRIINPAVDFYPDPFSNTYCDGAALSRGYLSALAGTVQQMGFGTTNINGVFPWGTRPGITQTQGEIGRGNLGLPGHADTFDGLQANYPTDAALTTFIQSGFGGSVPAPEFTGDDLKDIIYAIRRMSLQGSIPNPISSLVQRAPFETDVTAPVISSVVATRTGAGATTITVTWNTNKPTWGVVAAGFASAHGTGTPYHLFAREAYVAGAGNPSYKATGHSVTIDVFQDVLTYVVVIAKDIAGNNSVSAEVTVTGASGPPPAPPPTPPPAPPPPPPLPPPPPGGGISPDGTTIHGNTGGTLQTLYGTWDFGDQYAPPGPDGNVYRYPRLNGREILNITGIENNMLAFRQMVVDNGGNLYGLTFSSIWNVWDSYSWLYDGAYPPGSTTLDPLPPQQVTPPFTPSPDGTTITGGTGSLTSIDGVWSFGAPNGSGWNLMLNGTLVGISGGNHATDMIEINSHGQVWVRDPGGANWRLWLEQVLTTSPPPTSLPIPIGISIVPSDNTTISHTAPIGTLIAAITVTMSDGSAFAGSYTVGGNGNGNVYAAVSGNNLNVSVSPIPDYGTGTSEAIPIHATQNGFTIYKLFDVNPT